MAESVGDKGPKRFARSCRRAWERISGEERQSGQSVFLRLMKETTLVSTVMVAAKPM